MILYRNLLTVDSSNLLNGCRNDSFICVEAGSFMIQTLQMEFDNDRPVKRAYTVPARI